MNDTLMNVPPAHRYAEALRLAGKELSTGRAAAANGNEGQARVCGRRAVGVFVQGIASAAGIDYGSHAMANLREIQQDPDLPDEIRDAAARLNGGARSIRAGEPYSADPLGDAACIINYFVAKAL